MRRETNRRSSHRGSFQPATSPRAKEFSTGSGSRFERNRRRFAEFDASRAVARVDSDVSVLCARGVGWLSNSPLNVARASAFPMQLRMSNTQARLDSRAVCVLSADLAPSTLSHGSHSSQRGRACSHRWQHQMEPYGYISEGRLVESSQIAVVIRSSSTDTRRVRLVQLGILVCRTRQLCVAMAQVLPAKSLNDPRRSGSPGRC